MRRAHGADFKIRKGQGAEERRPRAPPPPPRSTGSTGDLPVGRVDRDVVGAVEAAPVDDAARGAVEPGDLDAAGVDPVEVVREPVDGESRRTVERQ